MAAGKSDAIFKRLQEAGLSPEACERYFDILRAFLSARMSKARFDTEMSKVLPQDKIDVHNAIIHRLLSRALQKRDGVPDLPARPTSTHHKRHRPEKPKVPPVRVDISKTFAGTKRTLEDELNAARNSDGAATTGGAAGGAQGAAGGPGIAASGMAGDANSMGTVGMPPKPKKPRPSTPKPAPFPVTVPDPLETDGPHDSAAVMASAVAGGIEGVAAPHALSSYAGGAAGTAPGSAGWTAVSGAGSAAGATGVSVGNGASSKPGKAGGQSKNDKAVPAPVSKGKRKEGRNALLPPPSPVPSPGTPAAAAAAGTATVVSKVVPIVNHELEAYDGLPYTPVRAGHAMDCDLFMKMRTRIRMVVDGAGCTGVKDDAVGLMVFAVEEQVKRLMEAAVGCRRRREGVRGHGSTARGLVGAVHFRDCGNQNIELLGDDASSGLERLSMLI